MASNTRTIKPTLVNEARFGYSSLYNTIGTLSAFITDSTTPLGIPSLPAGPPVQWGVPNVGFSGDGFSGIGDSSDTPYEIDDNILQFVDNLSWIHGKHTFRFGFEYNPILGQSLLDKSRIARATAAECCLESMASHW
jgi:hypothetical protein